jgi:hypothetical protein
MFVRFLRITLLTVLLARGAFLARGDTPVNPGSGPAGEFTAVTSNPSYGVRLRKLHLVRPDLIPYPLSLEVYC